MTVLSLRYSFISLSLIFNLFINSESCFSRECKDTVEVKHLPRSEKTKNIVTLDILGNRHIYDTNYKFVIQAIEGNVYKNFIKISTKNKNISTMRVSKLKYKLEIKKGSEYFLIIDNKAWSIAKCLKRIKKNRLDGDAHFILGVYYSIRKKFKNAIEMFKKPERLQYSLFNADTMYEWLGYTYYKLGLIEKSKKFTKKYLAFLKKEQQVYMTAVSNYEKSEIPLIFNYFYALSFIDLGFYLEEKEVNKKDISITMPGSVNITSSDESFEYAIKLITNIENPPDELSEKLFFLHEKIGQKEKADQLRRNRNDVRRKEANKKYLENRKQQLMSTQILKKMDFEKVFDEEFKPWYTAQLNYKYKPQNIEQLRNSDSLIEWKFSVVTKDLLLRYPETDSLNQYNFEKLVKSIHSLFFKRTMRKLIKFEREYYYQTIKDVFNEKKYWKVVFILDNFKTEDLPIKKTVELMEMKIESLKQMRIKDITNKNHQEEISAAQPESEGKDTLKENIDTTKTATQTVFEEEDTLKVNTDSTKKTVQTTPVYKQIGNIIKELVGKGDYIGAYRGLKAYEKLLKENFSSEEIDNTIRNVENVIEKKYGRRYLKNLEMELQQ